MLNSIAFITLALGAFASFWSQNTALGFLLCLFAAIQVPYAWEEIKRERK
jgi:hypothetical protein